jgi:DNA-binding transcriptional MerR regulator
MDYSVKQLADLASVSRRTLLYYDEIGLLRPTSVGSKGYRSYGEQALLRLQQVLFYRELGLELEAIRSILERPGFDVKEALQEHRRRLQLRIRRLEGLIDTLDKTLQFMKGQTTMGMGELFEGFDEETQARDEVEAAQRWGEDKVKESRRRWGATRRNASRRSSTEPGRSTAAWRASSEAIRQATRSKRWCLRGTRTCATSTSPTATSCSGWRKPTPTTRALPRSSPGWARGCRRSCARRSNTTRADCRMRAEPRAERQGSIRPGS